jgi:hypothetical protein
MDFELRRWVLFRLICCLQLLGISRLVGYSDCLQMSRTSFLADAYIMFNVHCVSRNIIFIS